MAGRYAQGTQVSPDSSRAEIERCLKRYGADRFIYATETCADGSELVGIGFTYSQRSVRFALSLPSLEDEEIKFTRKGQARKPAALESAQQQEIRRRWRALALAIKAKLEVVETGIATFDQEFLAHIVLPSGETTSDWLVPQLEKIYATGKLPPLLPYRE